MVKRILASLLLAACAFNANAQNLAPTVAITAPAANASVVAPASVTLTAEAGDSDGTVAKVEFYRDATLLATLTQAPYAYTFSADAPGSYALTAKATDDLNLTTTSAAQTLTVTSPAAAPHVFYIFSDQINTAREITNAAGTKVWQADPEPFGANLPNENPAGQGVFTYNPRFPGQYYDRETGLHYNYYRDYDPQTGRYVQSDPIGLDGGINTYGYVGGNPLSYVDPEGLQVAAPGVPGPAGAVLTIGGLWWQQKQAADRHRADGMAVYEALMGDAQALAATKKPPRSKDPQSDIDHKAYKDAYEQPQPPGLDPCGVLLWKLAKEKALMSARGAFDAKYGANWHGPAIAQNLNAIRNLERQIRNTPGCVCP